MKLSFKLSLSQSQIHTHCRITLTDKWSNWRKIRTGHDVHCSSCGSDGSRRANEEWFEVRNKQDWFHDSSIPPRKCAKSSESLPKPEKVWIIAIFAKQMLFFWSTNAIFFGWKTKKNWARSTNIGCLMAQVLLLFGASFAALWCEFCRLMAQY